MQCLLLFFSEMHYWLTSYKHMKLGTSDYKRKPLSIGDQPRMQPLVKVVIKLSCHCGSLLSSSLVELPFSETSCHQSSSRFYGWLIFANCPQGSWERNLTSSLVISVLLLIQARCSFRLNVQCGGICMNTCVGRKKKMLPPKINWLRKASQVTWCRSDLSGWNFLFHWFWPAQSP